MTQSIAEKLDEMLENDKTFSTRSGLRFMAELVRDAFQYIEDEKAENKKDDQRLEALENKIKSIDTALTSFLQSRTKEQEKAEDDRKRWRLATVAPILVLLFTELLKLILRR